MSVDYDAIAATYDSRYRFSQLPYLAEALRGLAVQVNARRVLEIGCGTGRWLTEFPSSFTIGVDASLGMLRLARDKARSAHLASARANALPFTGRIFDVVFAVNAIHHFDDPIGFLSDVEQLLTPGGVLAIVGIEPRIMQDRWFAYRYFEGTYDHDLQRFPAFGELVERSWLWDSTTSACVLSNTSTIRSWAGRY